MQGRPNAPRSRRRIWLAAAALLLAALPGAWALEAPSGKVVLTISGPLRSPNDGKGQASFDMAMLAALPQHSFTTKTPWYQGPRKFTGPLLRDVLAAAGVDTSQQGRKLEARAINDYKVTIPLDDAQRHEVLLARLMDDRPMAVRDKGPLFIIYPFDKDEQLRNTVYYGRSAWQLKALAVQ
ncbi:molybdopterin-dependent oxidoreductase [Roseateles violae]|uniref:Molybdopterin-dependent oxidoreductase n=1 Tax=Roseateles violae TaxID=3058042 RepID=A0ABT8DQ64_9BURK|nr:molybdopterin-dependent oxidoreductase [Pelomonas sp. PFR6]MDN3920136.1 molybdopterin-dependent oxidoreductase [Pelomonas sp. PFR6]